VAAFVTSDPPVQEGYYWLEFATCDAIRASGSGVLKASFLGCVLYERELRNWCRLHWGLHDSLFLAVAGAITRKLNFYEFSIQAVRLSFADGREKSSQSPLPVSRAARRR